MTGHTVWKDLKFYELTECERLANGAFFISSSGGKLNEDEVPLVESRFEDEAADITCPYGILLLL